MTSFISFANPPEFANLTELRVTTRIRGYSPRLIGLGLSRFGPLRIRVNSRINGDAPRALRRPVAEGELLSSLMTLLAEAEDRRQQAGLRNGRRGEACQSRIFRFSKVNTIVRFQ